MAETGSDSAEKPRPRCGPLYPRQQPWCCSAANGSFVPKAAVSRCSNTSVQKPDLLDHLVGAREQRRRNRQAERPGGRKVEDQLDFGGLLDRQIGGLLALENA